MGRERERERKRSRKFGVFVWFMVCEAELTRALPVSSICIDPAQLALKKVLGRQEQGLVLGRAAARDQRSGLRGAPSLSLQMPRDSIQPQDTGEYSPAPKQSSIEGLVPLSSSWLPSGPFPPGNASLSLSIGPSFRH